jgi:hypothetical protein
LPVFHLKEYISQYILLSFVHEWFEDTKGVIVAVGFIGGGTTDLPQVTDNIDYIMVYQVHFVWVGFELTTLVVRNHRYSPWTDHHFLQTVRLAVSPCAL